MDYCVTSRGSKIIDKWCMEKMGIPSMVLMERAALAVYDEVIKEAGNDKEQSRIVIFCGTGNNGADGLAVGRNLVNSGFNILICIVGNVEKASDELRLQYGILKKMKVDVHILDEQGIDELQFMDGDILVDAIFGIGLSRKIEGIYEEVINEINYSGKKVISVDIPSGLCGDRGVVMGCCVKAFKTITFGKMKAGLILCDGKDYVGEVIIKDVGFLREKYMEENIREQLQGEKYFFYEKEDIRMIPERKKTSHKGTYGTVTVVAGSENMSGAAVMCAKSVYRCGAGIVKVKTHENCMNIVKNGIYEAIVEDYTNDFEITDKDIVVIGPGLSVCGQSEQLVMKVLSSGCKAVIDADGLNVISKNRELLYELHQQVILTPHIKEMSRLCNKEPDYVRENIVEVTKEFAKKYKCVVVIKDAATVVANHCGKVYVNLSGNSGMSTGGSGDVLSGVIGGMLSQKLSVYQSACMGVYLHGMAGNIARDKWTEYGMMATDMIDAIPEVFKLR